MMTIFCTDKVSTGNSNVELTANVAVSDLNGFLSSVSGKEKMFKYGDSIYVGKVNSIKIDTRSKCDKGMVTVKLSVSEFDSLVNVREMGKSTSKEANKIIMDINSVIDLSKSFAERVVSQMAYVHVYYNKNVLLCRKVCDEIIDVVLGNSHDAIFISCESDDEVITSLETENAFSIGVYMSGDIDGSKTIPTATVIYDKNVTATYLLK